MDTLDFGSCQYEDIAIEVSRYYKDILKIEDPSFTFDGFSI